MEPIFEMGKPELREKKSSSPGTPTWVQPHQDLEPARPDSECFPLRPTVFRKPTKIPETSPREGQGGARQVEG